jgi:predicted ATPase
MIHSLKIEGFKSFGSAVRPIYLEPLNFVVGANASGKTNLIRSLFFLRDALLNGVDKAVFAMGGPREVRNRVVRERTQPKPCSISVSAKELPYEFLGRNGITYLLTGFDYQFQADLRTDDANPTVQTERLAVKLTTKEGAVAEYKLERDNQKVRIQDPTNAPDKQSREEEVPEQESAHLAAGVGFFGLPAVLFRDYVSRWQLYNISPHIARLPTKEEPSVELGPNGENLAVVLHEMEKHNGKGAMSAIVDGLKGAIPGFQGIKSVPLEIEGKWAFQVIEDKIKAINPQSASDGTVRLLTLMVIACWCAPTATLVAIEEPENGIHPHLSKQLVELFREASKHRQFIITTHNPSFLDHLAPNEVLLCDKGEDSFTKVSHASDRDQIEVFRKRFTLGELWRQGVLGGIP